MHIDAENLAACIKPSRESTTSDVCLFDSKVVMDTRGPSREYSGGWNMVLMYMGSGYLT